MSVQDYARYNNWSQRLFLSCLNQFLSDIFKTTDVKICNYITDPYNVVITQILSVKCPGVNRLKREGNLHISE